MVWVGGLDMPLVSVHLQLLDLGVIGADTWDGERHGTVVGGMAVVTF